MNPKQVFLHRFKQCPLSEAEFHLHGIPYKGSWPKQESMPLFIKDLEEAFEEAKDDEYDSIAQAKEKIAELETEIRELEKELEKA